MKTMFFMLDMLQNVQFTLTTNSDLLYPISDEILAYNNCVNTIKTNLGNSKDINNFEITEGIRKSLLHEFKFIASVLRSYAVMIDQAEILCDCKLKESNIELMNDIDLFTNLTSYLNFCLDNISFLKVFGLTEEYLLKMESNLNEISSIFSIRCKTKNNTDLNKVINEAQEILENEIDLYFERKKNECPQLFREYIKARHYIPENENNSLQTA